MREGFRFRPPPVEMTSEVRWLLARAFGPPEARITGVDGFDPSRIVEAGAELDLLARIAARTPREVLLAEVGDDLTAILEEWSEAAAVQVNCLRKMTGDIADVAADLKVPMVILKGMAVHLCGWATLGSRPMGDVDVLVPRDSAVSLQRALVRIGFEEVNHGQIPGVHRRHLRPLRSPRGFAAEIHFVLLDLVGAGGDSHTCDDLLEFGLVRPAPGLPGNCHIPDENLLVAHLLLHSIGQHGLSFGNYAAGRVFSDVSDVPWGPREWEAFLLGPFSWIENKVSSREIKAIVGFVERARKGEDPAEIASGKDDSAAVLNHLVAVVQWHDYQRLLALRRWFHMEGPALLWPKHEIGEGVGSYGRFVWRVRRIVRAVAKLAGFGVGQVRAALIRFLR